MTDAFLGRSVGDRLRRTLLLGHANGVPVTGRWQLCHEEERLPTFEVVVTLDHAPSGLPRNSAERGDSVERFEAQLRELLLETYAEGADPQGTWVASFPSAAVPDWWVEITVESGTLPERDDGSAHSGRFR